MKILVIATLLKSDLIEAISKNMVNLCMYAGRTEDVTFLVPSKITVENKFNFNVISYNDDRTYGSASSVLTNILKLQKYMKDINLADYDIVHYHMAFCIELFLVRFLLKTQKTKAIATVWQPFLEPKELLSLLKGLLAKTFHNRRRFFPHLLANTFFLRPLFKWGTKSFEKIIVASQHQIEQLKSVTRMRRIHRIANGVSRPNVQKDIDFSGNKLLYIGHFTPAKGIDDILECLYYLKNQINFSMTFALSDRGDKELFHNLMDKYDLGDYITLKNTVDVYNEMAQHDLFIMPYKTSIGVSYYPNVILECFAVGLPIIATSIDITKELIQNGKNGILTPVRNPKLMAKAIISVLKDKRLMCNISAFQKDLYREKYSLNMFAGSYMNLYRELVSET